MDENATVETALAQAQLRLLLLTALSHVLETPVRLVEQATVSQFTFSTVLSHQQPAALHQRQLLELLLELLPERRLRPCQSQAALLRLASQLDGHTTAAMSMVSLDESCKTNLLTTKRTLSKSALLPALPPATPSQVLSTVSNVSVATLFTMAEY
jgi:hypothetical protein